MVKSMKSCYYFVQFIVFSMLAFQLIYNKKQLFTTKKFVYKHTRHCFSIINQQFLNQCGVAVFQIFAFEFDPCRLNIFQPVSSSHHHL